MKLPKRNHISRNRRLVFDDIDYKQSTEKYIFKPVGFWYSCYNDWYDWVKMEMPEWLENYIHKIDIKPDVLTDIRKKDKNKILVIKNVKDFDLFNKRYGYKAKSVKKLWKDIMKRYDNSSWKDIDGDRCFINWKKVAEDYGGIEICPYIESRRKYLWYNMFDVASGCIWNIKPIIKGSKLIYQRSTSYVKV